MKLKNKVIRVGAVGLGRLGYLHAKDLLQNIPNAKLVAVCALEDNLLEEMQLLGVNNLYKNYDEFIDDPQLEAVIISSSTSFHSEHICKALAKKLHVFCEKPISFTIEDAKKVMATKEKYPDLITMLGYQRRYDDSYLFAKEMIDKGKIGKPIMMRSYTYDPITTIEKTIKYGPHSGGAFIDMAIHDIDLIFWYFNSRPKELWAIGGCYQFKEFSNWKDGDNVSCLMHLENDAMVWVAAGRIAPHGSMVETEIMGTNGILRIGVTPQKNLVEILNSNGIVKECYDDFIPRFRKSYLYELELFIENICMKNYSFDNFMDGLYGMIVAYNCKNSFETGEKIVINWEKELA